jgi:hypothetical protein
MQLSKRHNGKIVSIVACIGTIDEGIVLTGQYEHIEKKSSFRFHESNGTLSVFSRDDWNVIHVWKFGMSDYNWSK